MESRFLLAGADYLPIENFEEYTNLAKQSFRQVRCAPAGKEKELIDVLLARCVTVPAIV